MTVRIPIFCINGFCQSLGHFYEHALAFHKPVFCQLRLPYNLLLQMLLQIFIVYDPVYAFSYHIGHKWLTDEICGTGGKTLCLQLCRDFASEEDDGNTGKFLYLPYMLQYLETIHARHAIVKQNQVDLLFSKPLQGCFSAGNASYLCFCKNVLQKDMVHLVIINNKQPQMFFVKHNTFFGEGCHVLCIH